MNRIQISLLPNEMRRQSSIMKVWTIVAMILAIIAMILLLANVLLSLYIKQPVNELEQLKVELQSVTNSIGGLSYIQEMFDEMEANNADIISLKGNDPDWAATMDMVSSNAGLYGIKIERMDIRAKGENSGCILSCRTKDINNIERWSEYIKTQDGIGYVQMTDIVTNVFVDNDLEFQFNAVLGIDKWNQE